MPATRFWMSRKLRPKARYSSTHCSVMASTALSGESSTVTLFCTYMPRPRTETISPLVSKSR